VGALFTTVSSIRVIGLALWLVSGIALCAWGFSLGAAKILTHDLLTSCCLLFAQTSLNKFARFLHAFMPMSVSFGST